MTVEVKLLYFASLRDAAGVAEEVSATAAPDLRALYAEVRARHGFTMPVERIRVAVDGAFVGLDDAVREGNEIAFIPPVSGG